MDTDAAYIAFSSGKLDDKVKPHLGEHYFANRHFWFGRDDTKKISSMVKNTRTFQK